MIVSSSLKLKMCLTKDNIKSIVKPGTWIYLQSVCQTEDSYQNTYIALKS